MGDIIRGDIRIEVDGKEVYKDDDAELHLHDDRTILLPGFSEGVVGAVKDEPKNVEVTLPDDAESSLAGKTATVNVVVKEVKEERLPELNDEFAQGVGEGFPTLAALKERLRNDILRAARSAGRGEVPRRSAQQRSSRTPSRSSSRRSSSSARSTTSSKTRRATPAWSWTATWS